MTGSIRASKEGFCKRQTGFFKSWKLHWLSLRGAILHVSRKPNGKETCQIDIQSARIIIRAPECRKQPAFKICLPDRRPYVLVPPTYSETLEWIETLDSIRLHRQLLPRPHPAPVRHVGIRDFCFITNIGRGTYGIVQLVQHTSSGKYYAMKVMSKALIAEYDQITQILHERDVLLQTMHPFLVGAHYTFQTDTKVCMVLDYVPGGELYGRLKFEQKFSEPRAKLYAAEVLLGLGHLHSNGLAYRDLKPENILIDADGHLRITDFGLVKPGLNNYAASTSTFCGTPHYMAPEILARRGYTKAVDWWALGVLLYEMIVGFPPFWDENREKLYQKVLNDRVQFPPVLSPEAEDLILSLLEKNPSARIGFGPDDFEEIKQHPFFYGIFWPAVLEKAMEVEWKPEIKHSTDVSNFEEEFTSTRRDEFEEMAVPPLSVQSSFRGFSFVNESRL